MKKNKGFTLVELLAVIAILAILVIIALPNVMGMFNQAKKSSFTTEVKQIYKVAQQQWISDSMFETKELEYGRCSGCSYKQLELTGRQEINYHIKIDKAGNVIQYTVEDGTYSFDYSGPGLLVENITDDMVNPVSDSGTSNTQVVYTFNEIGLIIGDTIPSGVTTYNNYNDVNMHGSNSFSRIVLEDGRIKDISVGFLYNGTPLYLRWGPSNYSANKQALKNVIGEPTCYEDSGLEYGSEYYCSVPAGHIHVESDGDFYTSVNCRGCSSYEGSYSCINVDCQ